MPTLTEEKIKRLREFRAGLIAFSKTDLTPTAVEKYWEVNRDKLRPSGMTDNLGRYVQTIEGIDDVDALDDARDHIVKMLDEAIDEKVRRTT